MQRVPNLYSRFQIHDANQIILLICAVAFVIAWLSIYIKSKAIQRSEIIGFFRNLGFKKQDTLMYVFQQNIFTTFFACLFITVSSVTDFILLSKYFYYPAIIAIVLIVSAILISFIHLLWCSMVCLKSYRAPQHSATQHL
jgi:ABC-type antimicrobial peptide transport system permease subunit